MNNVELLLGDSRDILKELEDNSVDSIVTDPPYEIGFMGKAWDNSGIAYDTEFWKECMRVLKPGGHLLAFSHSRTYHRMAVAVEDAGFEIRDQILWVYGSGFPKSHNIGKAVDKLQGNEREVVGKKVRGSVEEGLKNGVTYSKANPNNEKLFGYGTEIITKGNSPYEGWGTALKPAHEPIVMGRKPFKGTVAENMIEWGTGGINIDGCRIGSESIKVAGHPYESFNRETKDIEGQKRNLQNNKDEYREGRFPANIIFDEEAGKILDEQSGVTKSSKRGAHNNKKTEHTNTYTPPQAMYSDENTYGDTGGASRFFYCPKASNRDRNEGNTTNHHPTVKPTDLLAYLVRLVTPKGGIVLDPFMGSGSTGKACMREGMNYIGIEMNKEYYEIAKARISYESDKNILNKFI